jgi:hypothetical protein
MFLGIERFIFRLQVVHQYDRIILQGILNGHVTFVCHMLLGSEDLF